MVSYNGYEVHTMFKLLCNVRAGLTTRVGPTFTPVPVTLTKRQMLYENNTLVCTFKENVQIVNVNVNVKNSDNTIDD